MYDPKDKYIQNLIAQASRLIRDAVHESTNKAETQEDIIKELKKLLPIEEKIEVWF